LSLFSLDHAWDSAHAPHEAERDFRIGHVQFYWCGTIAVGALGVPLWLASRYPQLDGGKDCIVREPTLREQQGDYSARYNKRMLALLRQTR